MNTEMILKLHTDFVMSNEYQNLEDSTKLTEIRHKACEELEKIVGTDIYNDIEDLVLSVSCEGETYGFIMGFKYAVRLMSECMC